MDDVISTGDLADLLGFSSRYTAELSAKGILVKAGHGKFKMRESVQGYVRHLKERAESPTADAGYEADKARKMKADADRAELETAKEAGKVVDASKVGKAWENAIAVAVGKLGNVGRKAAPRARIATANRDAAKIIEDEIRTALEELHTLDIAAVAAVEPARVSGGDGADASGPER